YYPFRPASDFFYLTGCSEPDVVLALVPEGDGHRAVLFVEPNSGKTDSSFFTDRNKGELWTGPRPGIPEMKQRFGIDDCRALGDLDAFLASDGKSARRARLLRGHSEPLEKKVANDARHTAEGDRELGTVLSEMRLLKDPQEVRELALAIAAT